MTQKLEISAIERFNGWFQERVRHGCPFCGERDWTVHDELAATATVETRTHAIDPTHGAPFVHLTCNHCAFTAAFSAVRIGLLDADA